MGKNATFCEVDVDDKDFAITRTGWGVIVRGTNLSEKPTLQLAELIARAIDADIERGIEANRAKAGRFSRGAGKSRGIERVPGRCSGRPVFVGTRMPVETVKLMLEAECSPDQVVKAFPALSLADVEAARRYNLQPCVVECPCGCGEAVEVDARDCGCEFAGCENDGSYPLHECDAHDMTTALLQELASEQPVRDSVAYDLSKGEMVPIGGLAKVCSGCGADIGTGYSHRGFCVACAEPHLNPEYEGES